MLLLPITDEQHRRVERAIRRFSPSWPAISAERRATAMKTLVLCEMIGGRSRTVDALGLRDNTLDNYRHGRTEPRYSALETLAKVAEVPVALLAHDWRYEEGRLQIVPVAAPVQPPRMASGFAEPGSDDTPIWGAETVSGPVSEAERERVARDRFLAGLPEGFLASLDLDRAALRIFRAVGDGMVPTIPDRAPMLVDTADHALTDGCIYLFRTEGDLLVRRVQRQPDGSLELIADNARRYRSRSVATDAQQALAVVGRVRAVTALL
jgi:hypothetical protein